MTNEKNTIKNLKQTAEPESGKKSLKRRGLLMSILDGSFMTREGILKQLPFIGYIVMLLLLYIAISYNAEKTAHEIDQTKASLIELRFEYITTKSALMNSTNMSGMAKQLEPIGIKPSHTPPFKFFTKKPTANE